jgi:hypothetical protein
MEARALGFALGRKRERARRKKNGKNEWKYMGLADRERRWDELDRATRKGSRGLWLRISSLFFSTTLALLFIKQYFSHIKDQHLQQQ